MLDEAFARVYTKFKLQMCIRDRLETARCLLLGGQMAGPYALVLGAEKISSLLDFSDRSTCVLFGDGAGAAVVRLDAQAPWAAVFGTRGDGRVLHGGGPDDPFLAMDGRAVFRFAVETVPRCIRAVLDKAGLTLGEVDRLVLHQANSRIIHGIARKLDEDPAPVSYTHLDGRGRGRTHPFHWPDGSHPRAEPTSRAAQGEGRLPEMCIRDSPWRGC